MTGKEICRRAKECKNVRYWYGGKGETATKSLADRLKKENPGVWTNKYYNTAMQDLGHKVGDCSYLVCHAYDRSMIGSSQIVAKYPAWSGTPRDGMICWKRGHVGIYEGGFVHELSSQARDYQLTTYSPDLWDAVLYDPANSYDNEVPEEWRTGWHSDNNGWCYRHTEGTGPDTYYHDTVKKINGHTYVFDDMGYICYLMRVRPSDSEGWIK